MDVETINQRYMLSRKAFLEKRDLKKILLISNQKSINTIWLDLKCNILRFLEQNNKKLIDERLLPTDLVFKFLDNQNLLKQIEKDFMLINQK